MTKKQVVTFWRNWCRARRVPTNIRMAGARVISADHEYWQSKSMSTLHDAVVNITAMQEQGVH